MQRVKSVTDLFVFLVKLGYRHYRPVSRTWNSVFILKHDASVLCVLFRKNGIDLRYFECYADEISIDSKNRAQISGGELYRNFYNESENFVHLKIAVVASCFSTGVLREELRVQDGQSYQLNLSYQSIRKRSRSRFLQRAQDLRDAADERGIYQYIRDDCGGYLGEGRWL